MIKSKDVLERLLTEDGIPFLNVDEIKKGKRSGNLIKKLIGFIKRMNRISDVIKRHQPDLLAGSAAELAVLGKLHKIPSAIFFEDDFEAIKPFALIAGPTATELICPDCCSAWNWNHKKRGYPSYHELAYLHPDHFTPDFSKVEHIFSREKPNFILRFVSLDAYHDIGKAGISDTLADQLIEKLEKQGNVFITSERVLPERFEKYKIRIPANQIHHALFFADLFIGDSQTMTAESAVLGTPSLRYSDFKGELSYLEELEINYQLTFGYRTGEIEQLLNKVDEILLMPNRKDDFAKRREKMLTERINFAKWMEEYFRRKLELK